MPLTPGIPSFPVNLPVIWQAFYESWEELHMRYKTRTKAGRIHRVADKQIQFKKRKAKWRTFWIYHETEPQKSERQDQSGFWEVRNYLHINILLDEPLGEITFLCCALYWIWFSFKLHMIMHVRHLEQRIVYNKRSIDVKHYQAQKMPKGR